MTQTSAALETRTVQAIARIVTLAFEMNQDPSYQIARIETELLSAARGLAVAQWGEYVGIHAVDYLVSWGESSPDAVLRALSQARADADDDGATGWSEDMGADLG